MCWCNTRHSGTHEEYLEYSRAWYRAHKKQCNDASKRWMRENRGRVNERVRRYRLAKSEATSSRCPTCGRKVRSDNVGACSICEPRNGRRSRSDRARWFRAKSERLDDGYVKQVIARGRIPASALPVKLVEAKRAQLMVMRLLKEIE